MDNQDLSRSKKPEVVFVGESQRQVAPDLTPEELAQHVDRLLEGKSYDEITEGLRRVMNALEGDEGRGEADPV